MLVGAFQQRCSGNSLDRTDLVFLLEGQRKAIDDGAQYLKQLGHAVVPLRLKDEAVEDVVYGLAHKGPVDHEFAVDAVENGLEIVPLARVLRVKQLQQPHNKVLVHVLFGRLGVRVIRDHVAQQELVHNLPHTISASLSIVI